MNSNGSNDEGDYSLSLNNQCLISTRYNGDHLTSRHILGYQPSPVIGTSQKATLTKDIFTTGLNHAIDCLLKLGSEAPCTMIIEIENHSDIQCYHHSSKGVDIK